MARLARVVAIDVGGVDFSGKPDTVSKWYLFKNQFELYMYDKGEKGLQEKHPR